MIAPRKIKHMAEKMERENLEFRTFLKCNADEKILDEQFAKLHNKLFEEYDCSRCRNCCKCYYGSIPLSDIKKDASTNQPERLHSLYSMLEAVQVCLVAFEIFERLKTEYGLKNKYDTI